MSKFTAAIMAALLIFVLAPAVSASPIVVFVEDLPLIISDKDFDDMIVTMNGDLSVVGSSGFGWQPLTTAPTYFNATNRHPGNFVTGSGPYAGNPYSPQWTLAETMYWGSTTGTADPSTYFHYTGGGVGIELLFEGAAFAPLNSLYWIGVNPTTHQHTGTWHSVLSGSAAAGSTVSFVPSEYFDLAIIGPGGIYSELCNGEHWGSMIQSTPEVPEPSTYALFGAGLLAIGILRRRQKRE